jgi:hypothetical protein
MPAQIVHAPERTTMASSKIKKKSTNTKASVMPRQGAIPCLVILLLGLGVLALFLFFGIRSAG